MLTHGQFLSDVVLGGLKVASETIVATKDGILDAIDDGAEFIEQYVDDPRVPSRPFSMPGWVSKIFNNPFTRLLSKINPLGWVLEALYEEIPELKLPDISKLITKFYSIFASAFDGMASLLQQLWESLLKEVFVASHNPSKIVESILNALKSVFWNFWDMATLFIKKTFECLSGFLDELIPLLTEEWNIPGLTDAWEELTEQKFTVLGFVTFAPATIINMTFAFTKSALPKFDPVNFDSIKTKPFYRSRNPSRKRRKLQSFAEEGKLKGVGDLETPMFDARAPAPKAARLINSTVVMQKQGSVQDTAENLNLVQIALNAQKPTNGPPQAENKTDDDEWEMPVLYELIFEDIGKTYSGFWNSFDSIVSVVAKHKAYTSPQAPPGPNVVTGGVGGGPGIEMTGINPAAAAAPAPTAVLQANGPPDREAASRWWVFFRGIGKVLQGGALISSAVCTTRNTVANDNSHTTPKVTVAILGLFELGFFTASVVKPSAEELLGIVADCCGSAGTIVRCVDDNRWDGQAIADVTGSSAVVVKIVADQIQEKDAEPFTKLCLAGAGVACAFTDTGCSIYGLYECVERCAT